MGAAANSLVAASAQLAYQLSGDGDPKFKSESRTEVLIVSAQQAESCPVVAGAAAPKRKAGALYASFAGYIPMQSISNSAFSADQVLLLIAEVQNLNATVKELVATTPQRTKTWIEPRELAALLGVSTRTIANWRESGRFAESSYRPTKKGYQFHSQKSLADAQSLNI